MLTATDGFFFALHLVESLGATYDRDELLRRLREVAAGDTSVFNSPQEELAKLEAEKGPGTEAERADLIGSFAHRRAIDAHHREVAMEVDAVVRSEYGPSR